MNPVLSQIKLTPIGHILGYPASCVFIPRAVFDEYHLRAFDCTVIGEYLEICRFVVKDKDRGKGHGSRLLSDLDAWAKERDHKQVLKKYIIVHKRAEVVCKN